VGHDDINKQPTPSRTLLTNAKAMKGTEEIAAKPNFYNIEYQRKLNMRFGATKV
jgi:hypothetical protein